MMMKRIKFSYHRNKLLLFTAVMMFTACGNYGDENTLESPDSANTSMLQEHGQSHESMQTSQHLVEYAALDFMFAGPSEIPSGWTTFRMPNQGEEHHVMILIQLPEGVSYAEYNEATEQRTATGETPGWWSDLVIMGGPAALAPGLTGETTVKLDPGKYAMVCPVQTADGTMHSSLGMMRPLTVTDENSGAPEPETDITMTLQGLEFEMEGVITPGRHTVRVRFEDQPEGKPHDVHVARLGLNQTVEGFAKAMETPSTSLDTLDVTDFYFIGGAEDMPEGTQPTSPQILRRGGMHSGVMATPETEWCRNSG